MNFLEIKNNRFPVSKEEQKVERTCHLSYCYNLNVQSSKNMLNLNF